MSRWISAERGDSFSLAISRRDRSRLARGSMEYSAVTQPSPSGTWRGGLSSTFDELNKFFTISGMPVASSQYWNSIHGRLPGEAAQDAEGLQTMRTLARNMAFLVKSIALGREKYGLPEREEPLRTHFIR